jgi:ectoine hydroxylase-related dioxygenase (phytanoyl-CoA dioxygenase family)
VKSRRGRAIGNYRAIGVALSRSHVFDGCLCMWPASRGGIEREPLLVELDAGDVVAMHPALLHCSTLNRSSTIRHAAYSRRRDPPNESLPLT